jgi:AraC-like DNA-binding protein
MLNVYDFMKDLPANKRLIVNDLVFADYKCPLSHTRFDMWTHHNYFVYVIKGKKKWFAHNKEVMASAGYFHELCNSSRPSLQAVMESNFAYPMKLEEYARLSGRSLSLFKKDFKKIYQTTPGRWLTQKRLEYGRYLIENTDKTVTEVVLDCGLKNSSHFSKAFKKQFGESPVEFKKTF